MSSKYVFTNNWFDGHAHKFGQYLNKHSNQEFHILEIGSHEGKSTTWFIDNILHNDLSTITSIDPYLMSDPTTPVTNETHNLFLSNVLASKYPSKLTQYVLKSKDAFHKLVNKTFDLIYIDGSHLAMDVLYDAVNSWNLLKTGGILWFDDYGSNNHPDRSPHAVINLFINVLEPDQYKILFKDWQLALIKLRE